MNIIGLIVPKIVSLLCILIPSISPHDKAILAAIWLFKLIIDYDIAKPGHRGKIYVLTKKVSFEIGELIIIGVQLIPAVVYLVVTVLMGAWIAFVPGVIGIVYCLFSFIR